MIRATFVVCFVLIAAACAACSDSDSSNDLGPNDARCVALCKDTDAACAADVRECEAVCQVRVKEMQPLCATCLIENANAGICGGGSTCCPDAAFPNSPIDCATECSGSIGVNPVNHPVCVELCATANDACSPQAAECMQACQARVTGVSGLCALCLLEGARNGACNVGSLCCPDPSFPATTSMCAAVCGA